MEEGAAEKLVDNKPISNLFLISLRLLRRDWKGGELRLLFLALIMAVTSITGIALFTDRLEKALLLESANMLAADRIVSGRGDLPREVLTEGQTRGLSTAEVVSFTSMAFSETGNILVAAKAVTDAYPLRGEVIVSEQAFVRGTPIGSGPPQGEVWLESRAMAALDIDIGDFVSVGEAELRVGKIIVAEPDRGGGSMMSHLLCGIDLRCCGGRPRQKQEGRTSWDDMALLSPRSQICFFAPRGSRLFFSSVGFCKEKK